MSPAALLAEACDPCLRRGHLVGLLAPRIAGMIASRGSSPPRGLLALDDSELIAAVAGGQPEAALRFIEEFDPATARERLAERRTHAV